MEWDRSHAEDGAAIAGSKNLVFGAQSATTTASGLGRDDNSASLCRIDRFRLVAPRREVKHINVA